MKFIIPLLIAFGVVLVSVEASAQDSECISRDQFVDQIVEQNAASGVEVFVAEEVFGDPAAQFAAATGYQGEAIRRAILLAGIDENGKLYPVAFVVLFNMDGCATAQGQFPLDAAGAAMRALKERGGA